jgi:hypothetical protein
MWVVIYMCMEAMFGISLYSYLYPKLAKTICSKCKNDKIKRKKKRFSI